MYSEPEPGAQQFVQQPETTDENELLKEKLAYSYLWSSPNLDWWWSSAASSHRHLPATTGSALSTANSLSAAEYRPFIAANSTVHYNQKVISKNNQMLIVLNDTSTTKPNQRHHLAIASLRIEAFLNDSDYLCLIRSNPEPSDATPNKAGLSTVARIAVRRKRRPLILSCSTLEIPVLLIYLKEQVADHRWLHPQPEPLASANHAAGQANRRTPINGGNRKSISVAAEPNDSVSFYCSALRGALMVQFSWRDVKHGQLLGAISHTFVQPSIEPNWRRSLNATSLIASDSNGYHHFNAAHQQFLNQQSPLTKSELNAQANYTVRLHFNPKLPELITAELRLAKVNLEHFFTQFQCLVSNELGSDSAVFEVRRKSVPDQVNQVHVRQLNGHRLVLSWLPGFDGGFHQQYIIRYALKNELERAIQSKQSLASTHTMSDLQHPNSVHSRESLNEVRRMKAADESDVLLAEEEPEQDAERPNRESTPDARNYGTSSTSADIQWRTEQDKRTTRKPYHGGKQKNLRKRVQIKWNSFLLSPNGPIAQIGNERLVSNETQIEFTDLKPSSEYYFSVLSKNRLGLAREHSVPILIRTPKADSNPENTLDQVQSNLQLGENSLGLIEHGLLTNSTTRSLTIWLLVAGGCAVVLVNVVVFALYCRQRTAKLTGTLTTAGSSSTNSTQSTTLSSTLSTPQSKSSNKTNPSVCDENQMESNEKGRTIANDNNEMRLDGDRSAAKKTTADDHCIMNSNDNALLTNGNVTFTLMTDCPADTLGESNQIDYLKDKQSPNVATSVNNGQSASLVYAQLRPDNSVANCLLQAKTGSPAGDLSRYGYATIHSMAGSLDGNGLSTLGGPHTLGNYSNFSTNKNCSKSGQILQTRVNKLSADYKERYIPYYLNDHLLSASLEPELNCWDSSLIADFYSTNAASSLSGKLTSNSLLASFTPSPSTYSSQLPHLITSSSLATTNTLSPIGRLTPSTAYSYRTLSSATTTQLDDNQLKLANPYDQFSSPTFTGQAPPLLASTLAKNHTTNGAHHYLAGDFMHPDTAFYGSQNYPKLAVKKSPNKSNHCKVVSFANSHPSC